MVAESRTVFDPAGLPDDTNLLTGIFIRLSEFGAHERIVEMIKRRPSRQLLSAVLSLASETVTKILELLKSEKGYFDYIIPTIHAIALSLDDTVVLSLRGDFQESVGMNVCSVKSLPSTDNYHTLHYLPDEVLTIILFHASDSVAFSELIPKRVCKRWSTVVDSKLLIPTRLGMARHYAKSLIRQTDILLPDLDGNSVLTQVFFNWTYEELELEPTDLHIIRGMIERMTNVDPIKLARVLKNLCVPGNDSQSDFMFQLPRPSSFTTVQTCTLVQEIVKSQNVKLDFGKCKGARCLKSTMVLLEGLVVDGKIPENLLELFSTIFNQHDFTETGHIPIFETKVIGECKYSRVIMDKVTALDLKHFDMDSEDFDFEECLWLSYRVIARDYMRGERTDMYRDLDSWTYFILDALLDARDPSDMKRLLEAELVETVDSEESEIDIEQCFYGALCMLVNQKDFNVLNL